MVTSPEHPSILLSKEIRVLVQSLAPIHRTAGCRDAGYGWLDYWGYGFEYSAECCRDTEYLRRCSHTSTGAGAAGFLERCGAIEVLLVTVPQTAKFTSQAGTCVH